MLRWLLNIVLLVSVLCPTLASEHRCGEVKIYQPVALIAGSGAIDSYPGQWPWFSPVYWNNSFACGSSLISDRHLLAPAHCLTFRHEEYHVLIGRFDLKNDTEPGTLIRKLSHAFVHPNYNQSATISKSNGDIAVLRMQQKVQFTDRIQPVCLPQPDEDSSGLTGTVVGYGYHNVNKLHENRPKQMQMTSIDWKTCISIASYFINTVSERSFCALGENAAPCRGDSGSGYYVVNRATGQYTTYGIASHASKFGCLPDEYTIFVDLPPFIEWINEKTARNNCSKSRKTCISGMVKTEECKSSLQERGVCRKGEMLQTFRVATKTKINGSDFEIAPELISEDVKKLYMSGVSARFLPIKLYLAFPNLLVIVANSLQVDRITRQSFENLSKLRYLELSGNQIKSIEENSLSDLQDLVFLNLFDNKLTRVRSSMFQGLHRLRHLGLGRNQIRTLAEDSFADLSQLTELKIPFNELQAVGEQTFAPLTSLEKIDLSFNVLSTLSERVFESNPKLRHILLWNNQITKLSYRPFENKPQLAFVSLKSNTCIDFIYGSLFSDAPPLIQEDLDELKDDIQLNCSA